MSYSLTGNLIVKYKIYKNQKKMKIGIVGNGNIAKFHVEAFTQLGLKPNLIVSRNGSKTAVDFKNKYAIEKLVDEKEFIEKEFINELDGLIIACNTEKILSYIDLCKQYDTWVLSEKPVSYDLEMLKINSNYKKCMVAFNRRFYPNIIYLK